MQPISTDRLRALHSLTTPLDNAHELLLKLIVDLESVGGYGRLGRVASSANAAIFPHDAKIDRVTKTIVPAE